AVRLPVMAASLLPAALVALGICGLVLVATGSGATATWAVAAPAVWLLPRSFQQVNVQVAVGKLVQRMTGGPGRIVVSGHSPRFYMAGPPPLAALKQRFGAASSRMTIDPIHPPGPPKQVLSPAHPPGGQVAAIVIHSGSRFPGFVTWQGPGARGGV